MTPNTALAYPDEPLSLDETDLERVPRFHLWGDLALYVGGPQENTDAWALSPLFGLRVLFHESFALEAQWGLAHATLSQNGDRDTGVRPGNALIAAHYLGKKKDFSYRIGVGATAPIATLPDDLNDRATVQAAFTYAAAMRGNWDFWLWDPHAISIVLPAKFERLKASGFLWGMEMGFGVLIPISDKNEDLDIAIQTGFNLGYQALSWLRVGSRFHLVLLPLLDGQKTQLAAEPYGRIGNDNAFFDLRLLVNIDNPHGFAFDKNRVWGLRIGGGFAF